MLRTLRNKGRALASATATLALAGCLAFALAGCSSSDGADGSDAPATPAVEQKVDADAEAAADAAGTITFTDDLGRTVELPAQIDKICPSGFTAQQVLLTMAPDKMVGLAQELTDDQLKIFGEKFADYPVFGAVLGATDSLNREAVAAAAPTSPQRNPATNSASSRMLVSPAAAGAEHEAHTAQDHQNRHDEVDGGERRFAHKVRYEKAVHHAVDGGEDHHDDGWNHKPDQFPIVKMF